MNNPEAKEYINMLAESYMRKLIPLSVNYEATANS